MKFPPQVSVFAQDLVLQQLTIQVRLKGNQKLGFVQGVVVNLHKEKNIALLNAGQNQLKLKRKK